MAAVHTLEYVIFAVLVGGNIIFGLYFSLPKKKHDERDTDEIFLGKRSFAMFPLAVSVLASMTSALGIVGFTAHYYAYGIHMIWSVIPILLTTPIIAEIIVPVFYRLKITSIFQYHRMRFGSTIAVATCGLFFLFAETVGALCIYTASLAVSTVFDIPVSWVSLVIGFTGTVYTALGGLRGVVWTDCVQAVVTVGAPATIIIKVLCDAHTRKLRPFTFEDFKPYAFQYRLDFSQDENVWSCIIGLCWSWIYRAGLDQVMVQRYLASRSLQDAKRTAWWGMLLILAYFAISAALGLIMAYWYRDCDPLLTGAISKTDEMIPYYVNTQLSSFLGFCGIFLAGVVGATTSTISSIINSLAAVTYVEFVAFFGNTPKSDSVFLPRGLAMASGTIMSLYAIVIPFMGSTGRVLMVLQNCISAPFVGLSVLGLGFPWVNTKAAVIAALLGCTWQATHAGLSLVYGNSPPRMAATTNGPSTGPTFLISSYWSNALSTTLTILIGVILSLFNDDTNHYKKNLHLTSSWFLKIWVNAGLISENVTNVAAPAERNRPLLENAQNTNEVVLLSNYMEHGDNPATAAST